MREKPTTQNKNLQFDVTFIKYINGALLSIKGALFHAC